MSSGSQVIAEIAAPPADLRECWAQMPEIEQFDVSPAEGEYFRCALTPRDGVDLRPQIFELARERGWPLRELTRSRHSLEDIYVRVTRPDEEEEALMRAYWTLTRRELASFFLSLTGYVIIAAALFLMGFSFVVMLVKLQSEPTPMPVTELFLQHAVLLADPAAGDPGHHHAAVRAGEVLRHLRDADDHAGERSAGGAGQVHRGAAVLHGDVAAAAGLPAGGAALYATTRRRWMRA